MATPTIKTDVAIFGGGVAGLWALNRLRDEGYSALLFEEEALGSAQTIASQGIIHSGIKYALGGLPTTASESIAAMPALWRDCLEGRGPVDLRACKLLSESCHLWSTAGAGGRLAGFLASQLLHGSVLALQPCDYPAALQHPDFRGRVYRLPDPVLDIPSLLATLATPHSELIFKIDWRTAGLHARDGVASLTTPDVHLQAQCMLLTAGGGNEALLASLGAPGPAMQRRPLQQVLVKHEYEAPLFGHCIGHKPSPRLTISSHRSRDGQPVWYLGGDLATAGAAEEPGRLIDRAREELEAVLPWIDLGDSQWCTLTLDRAEPRQSRLRRPDTAFVETVDGVKNALVGWPGKLTLAPRLGEAVLDALRHRDIQPRHQPDLSALSALPRPEIATPRWERGFT